MGTPKHNWTLQEISEIYHTPLLELLYNASTVHRQHHHANKVKISMLISVKTGACTEDCAYCSQSSRYNTFVDHAEKMSVDAVLAAAKEAKESGVERVCLSASWGKVPSNKDFDDVLTMIEKIKAMDMSVCCTLGMIDKKQAKQLSVAGITAYNHNLDTSKDFYKEIISTRTFADRLETIENLMEAGVNVCSGGILGMGESEDDRISMLHILATLEKHPYTVPLNCIVPVKGTPLENTALLPVWDMVRMIATARIIMPETMLCLAAGRTQMTDEGQALCYIAGVNSIFVGKKLLTTPNPDISDDMKLMQKLGLEVYDKEN